MFRAIGRWFRAVGYLLTGQIDSARRTLDSNPQVVRAKFDDIVREKTGSIHTYKQALSSLVAQREMKVGKVSNLTDEIGRLERLKAGALAKAKQTVEKMQAEGKSMEEIKTDEDYLKCLSAFNDFTSTLEEKQARIAELEADIGEYGKRVGEHKVQLQELLREVDKLKSEAADTIADLITAKEEKEIAETIAGIAKDGTAEELQRMRQLRQEVKAEAKVTKELAGTSTKTQEAEFLEYARKSSASTEFDQLIGLAQSTEAAAASKEHEAPDKTALPE
jgi:chromosome segregation ATPase